MSEEEQDKAPDLFVQQFLDALPDSAMSLLTQTGSQFVEETGLEVVRDAVLDVLCGANIRDMTESLTRMRLALLNAAMVAQYVATPGLSTSLDTFIAEAGKALATRQPREARWVLNWALGLTGKGQQNVLRDGESREAYLGRLQETLNEAAETAEDDFGPLSGTIKIGDHEVPLTWQFFLYLAMGIGAQTLTIRGSDKSRYGKLFEKLILGSVLSILGFQFTPTIQTSPAPRQFWLSSRSKRESDATAIIAPGKGVRFDMGFIGRGNSEISLDKVSRFERVAEFNATHYNMATVIIVDRIGKRSKLEELARQIDGTIIQMSIPYWPKALTTLLHERFKDDYQDDLMDANDGDIRALINERLKNVPLGALFQKASQVAAEETSKSKDDQPNDDQPEE